MENKIDRWDDSRLLPLLKEVVQTPSGKFELIINYYDQGKGYWNYTRGQVYRISDHFLVCDIKRNYSAFTYSFIITKNNTEWLICGKSYMGQTIVNLETGEIFDDEKTKTNNHSGYEFCWSSHKLLGSDLLLVEGCHWAAPYEYRFYDFSDPSKGWKELPIVAKDIHEKYKDNFNKLLENRTCLYSDEDNINLEYINGKITYVYKTNKIYLPLSKLDSELSVDDLNKIGNDDHENPDNWKYNSETIFTLERKDNCMLITNIEEIKHK